MGIQYLKGGLCHFSNNVTRKKGEKPKLFLHSPNHLASLIFTALAVCSAASLIMRPHFTVKNCNHAGSSKLMDRSYFQY